MSAKVTRKMHNDKIKGSEVIDTATSATPCPVIMSSSSKNI
jgi:hypothetical protein